MAASTSVGTYQVDGCDVLVEGEGVACERRSGLCSRRVCPHVAEWPLARAHRLHNAVLGIDGNGQERTSKTRSEEECNVAPCTKQYASKASSSVRSAGLSCILQVLKGTLKHV